MLSNRIRRSGFGVLFIACAMAVTLLGGCSDDDENPVIPETASAFLRVFHLSADAPAVDAFLNMGVAPAVTGLAFGEATEYAEVPAGMYRIDISGQGGTAAEAVLTVPSIMLEEDTYYTAVAFDDLADISALALVDDYQGLAAGNLRVRAIHAAAAVGEVDIWNIPSSGSPSLLYENVGFGQVGMYLDLPAGAYRLGFDVDDDATPDLTFSLPALPAGTVANVFAVNNAGGDVFLLAQLESGAPARIDPDPAP